MVLASLKHHTEHLHRRVEAAVDLPRRVRTARGYVELLARLYGFYEPFERRVAAARALDALGLDLAARRKLPLLAADLAHLGCDPGTVASLPRCEALPEPRTAAEALGCLYVIEGSTLGGRIIRQHVERSLGLSGPGVAFFSSYGDEVGRRWKAFCAVVESAVVSPDEQRAARESAAATFEAFEGWVAGPARGDQPDGSGS